MCNAESKLSRLEKPGGDMGDLLPNTTRNCIKAIDFGGHEVHLQGTENASRGLGSHHSKP